MPFGAIRALAVLLIGTGFVTINIPAVSAQDAVAPTGVASPDSSESAVPSNDAIAAAERALVLEEGPAGAGPTAGPSSIGSAFRMVLTLAVAAAAIYGVIYFIKRASRRTETTDPFLKVLATTPLGSNRSAHVVSVGSKAWLVGASDGGINLIGEIEDKDILNAMFLEDSRKSAETPAGPGRFLDFKTMLRRLGMPVPSGAPDAENIRKRRERLKGL